MSNGPSSAPRVLIVDDDADVVKAAALLLSRQGFSVRGAAGPAEARSQLAAEGAEVVLLDLNFTRGATSGEEGLVFLRQLLRDEPEQVVVVVTAHSGVNVAVKAMQAGARDFVIKPWNNQRLVATVQALLPAARPLVGGASEPEPMLLGESPVMEEVRRRIARAAPTGAPVLVTGEAGLGKSLAARRLHLGSPRAEAPFVVLDLAARGPAEVEDALFAEAGALAKAGAGTLVLDEIGELPVALQGRLGAMLERGAAARVISTSRRSVQALGGRGGLKDELLYRLGVIEIALPPLTARGNDPPLLADHFLRQAARRHARPPLALSPVASRAIMAAPWTGGVRALAQAMERAALFAEGATCEARDLGLGPDAHLAAPPSALDLQASERALVAAALKRHRFNVSHAAKDLGLTRPALYRRMAKHGL
jgi:DNA-binding NtrC family response regulator